MRKQKNILTGHHHAAGLRLHGAEQAACLAASGQTAGAARTLGALSARLPSRWATGASWGGTQLCAAPTALWWPVNAEPLGGGRMVR